MHIAEWTPAAVVWESQQWLLERSGGQGRISFYLIHETQDFDPLSQFTICHNLSKFAEIWQGMWRVASYHSMMISRHFLPWCMFSYRLRMRTMCGPADTRQWSSTSRLALGQSYRIWEADGQTASDGWGRLRDLIRQRAAMFNMIRKSIFFCRCNLSVLQNESWNPVVCLFLNINVCLCVLLVENLA